MSLVLHADVVSLGELPVGPAPQAHGLQRRLIDNILSTFEVVKGAEGLHSTLAGKASATAGGSLYSAHPMSV
jgi:hypothetical protein